MKAKLALFFFLFSILAQNAYADTCSTTIKDRFGYEQDFFIKYSYSIDDACSMAMYDCQVRLSEYQSRGQHYSSQCVITHVSDRNTPPSYPPPHPPSSPSYPPSYPSYPDRPREPREPRYPDRPREPRYPRDPKPPRPPRWPR